MSESNFKNRVDVKVKEYLNSIDFIKLAKVLDDSGSGNPPSINLRDPIYFLLRRFDIIKAPIAERPTAQIKEYLVPLTLLGYKLYNCSKGDPELYKYNFGLLLKNFTN